MKERYEGEKVFCKMSEKEAKEFINGKTIEGHKVSIIVERD